MKIPSAFCLLVLVIASGCSQGPKLIPVTGVIKVNSKPAEGALLYFHPAVSTESTASGIASADGTFELMTNGEKGLVAGSYKVTVIWPDPSKKPTQARFTQGEIRHEARHTPQRRNQIGHKDTASV
jgi:hypothetical protein